MSKETVKIKCLGLVDINQWITQVRVLETVTRRRLFLDRVTERERVYTCLIREHRWFDEDGHSVGYGVSSELYAILAKNLIARGIDRYIWSV